MIGPPVYAMTPSGDSRADLFWPEHVADVWPRHPVRCGEPGRTSGGPFQVKPHRDRNHLRHDLDISLQGCGIIGGRC